MGMNEDGRQNQDLIVQHMYTFFDKGHIIWYSI